MSFVKLLQGIGDRLGILETVPASGAPAAVRIETRSVSLRELTGEIKSGAVQSLADAPSELAVPFEKIYEAAGISQNPQDWTTDRLKQVIEGEPCRNKPREEAQRAILAILNSAGIAAEMIVKDAIARDQALDAYETVAREKMKARIEMRKKHLSAAESRIKDLQEECRTLEKAMKDDEDKFKGWKRNKRARERELASIVSYIVDHKVITSEEEEP
jgi:hypothetical protein